MLPRVKPYLDFVPLAEDLLVKGPGVFLRYSGEAVPVVLKLLPLLDGTRSPEELARITGHPVQDVLDVLEGLAADRLVEDAAADEVLKATPAEAARLAPQLGVWSHLTRAPARAQNRLADARVLVIGGGILAEETRRLLQAAGVGEVASEGAPTGWSHVVLATDQPAPRRFLELNEECLRTDTAWTGAFLDGVEASIGPTVLPHQSACWRCYDLRVKGAHPNLDRLLRYEAATRGEHAPLGLPSFAPIAAGWLAQAVLMTLAQASLPPLAGHVARVDFLEMGAQRHRVLRIPRCPACSQGDIPDVDRYALEHVAL